MVNVLHGLVNAKALSPETLNPKPTTLEGQLQSSSPSQNPGPNLEPYGL